MLTGTEVTAVTPVGSKKVKVEAAGRPPQEFDAVVLATHSDQALKLLGRSAQQAGHRWATAVFQESCSAITWVW